MIARKLMEIWTRNLCFKNQIYYYLPNLVNVIRFIDYETVVLISLIVIRYEIISFKAILWERLVLKLLKINK